MSAVSVTPGVVSVSAYIYGLFDPHTTELRYIGKAKNVHRRLALHLCPTQLRPKTHKNHWIKSLLSVGRKPEVSVFEEVVLERWEEAEKFWIEYFQFLGCRLTNGTSGGDGLHDPSPETRWRCGSSNRGKKLTFSPEHRAKIAVANRERAKNPEWLKQAKENLSIHRNKNGHSWRVESRQKASESARNRKVGLR